MAKKYNTESFIERARQVHGDKYDYSKVEYVDTKTKVCIVCPKHGEFWQSALSHISGHGCNKCAAKLSSIKNRLWTEEKCKIEALQYKDVKTFREESKHAYDAAVRRKWLKNYTWLKHKITLEKNKKARKKYTNDDIINQLKLKFGDTYGYEFVNYKAMKKPITLICHVIGSNGQEHGEFSMRPDNIFSGNQGCPKCWKERRSSSQMLSQEEFIKRSKSVHNNLYEYYKVIYKGSSTKVCIVCPIHGDFWQTPSGHMSGHGCPYCSGNAKKWNKETCKKEAYKYEYVFDFSIKSSGAYNVARKNGWLDQYVWLKKLPPKSSDYNKDSKYIYAYEFVSQKAVYVGLTNSIIKRDKQHNSITTSTVNKFALSCKCDIPNPKTLDSEVPISESGEREAYWINRYKQDGWQIINKAKTGSRSSSIGATFPLKWNKNNIREKAKECNYDLAKFMRLYIGAYEAIHCRYKGLLNELFPNRMIHTHHTIEDAMMVVKQGNYSNRNQLRKNCLWAHNILYKNGKLEEVFGKPKEYTKQEALNQAKEYKSIDQIRSKNYSLWKYLKKNDLFKVAKPTDAMFRRVKTVSEAWELSQHYRNKTDLCNHAKLAYRILKQNDLLDKRYPIVKTTPNYEACKIAYSNCLYVKDVHKFFPKEYSTAKKEGWHTLLRRDYLGLDLEKNNKPNKLNANHKIYWTRNKCEEHVKKYTRLQDLLKNEPNLYQAINRNNWKDLLKNLERVQHTPYSYTIEEIKEICTPYHNLAELSKARKDIDNYCRKNGIDLYELNGWKNLVKREVSQILDNVEVGVFPSIVSAANFIHGDRKRLWDHIHKGTPYMGYIWKYKNMPNSKNNS